MSLELFSNEEHRMLIEAASKYGNAFTNAYNSTLLLSNLVMWPVSDCDTFFRFYSQVKKYHTLSVVSTARLHRIQAKMNLRYFLESTTHAAFSLAHTDTHNYIDPENYRIANAKKAAEKAYAWLGEAYPDYSTFIRDLKNEINDQTAHAHIVNSQYNFHYIPQQSDEIITSYFDFEDEALVKCDLWIAAKAGLYAAELILAVRSDFGGFLPTRCADDLAQLKADNDAVRHQLQGT